MAAKNTQQSTPSSTRQYNIFPSYSPPDDRIRIPSGNVGFKTNMPTPPYTPVRLNASSQSAVNEWNAILKQNNLRSKASWNKDNKDNGLERPRTAEPGHGRINSKGSPKMIAHNKPNAQQAEPVYEAPLEARYMISLTAETLGWDFIYIVRIYPTFSSLASARFPDITSLNGAGGGEFDRRYIRLLISHGLPTPVPTFSLALHMNALRSAGGLVYRDYGGHEEQSSEVPKAQCDFQFGMMIPISRDPVRRLSPGRRPSTSSSCSCSCSSMTTTSTITGTANASVRASLPNNNTHIAPSGPHDDSQEEHNQQRDTATNTKNSNNEDGLIPDVLLQSPHCEGGLVLGAFHRIAPKDYTPSFEEITSLREAGRKLQELLEV